MTIDEDTFIGVGNVIRFIPSEGDPTYRGYDISIFEAVSAGREFMNETVFLRMHSQVSGISGGELVLVVALRTDRSTVFTPGFCTPVVAIPESQLEDIP